MTRNPLIDLLQEIKKRSDEATPGPWKNERCNDDELIMQVTDTTGWREKYPFAYIAKLGGWGYTMNNNEQFIAHARTDVPKLFSVIEKLIEQLNSYRESNHFHQMDSIREYSTNIQEEADKEERYFAESLISDDAELANILEAD